MAQHIAINRKEHQITDLDEAMEVVQKYGCIECWEIGEDGQTKGDDPVWKHGTTDAIGDRADPVALDLEPQANVTWDEVQCHYCYKEKFELLPENQAELDAYKGRGKGKTGKGTPQEGEGADDDEEEEDEEADARAEGQGGDGMTAGAAGLGHCMTPALLGGQRMKRVSRDPG